MKNKFIYFFKNKIYIQVKGNNIERFIKRLKNNKIDILNIKYISLKEIYIEIYKKDYDKLSKIKTIYEINIINYNGYIKYKNNVLKNKYIILFILIFLIIIYILSNLIFEVKIIANDNKMEDILLEELEDYNIKKYKVKPNYLKLQQIKKNILNKHKNDIEWIEIENIGTKYIIRYEPRIINKEKVDNPYRNIVAKKDSVIKKIYLKKGQIIKDVNTYVKKGDIIVSGEIKLNDEIKDIVSSEGKIYGEVWYKVKVNYPFNYYEEKETGNKKKVLSVKFLNKYIYFFDFDKFENKKVTDNIIIKNNILPIFISFQLQKEINIIREKNSEKDLIDKVIKISENNIKNKLKEGEYIENYKILNKSKYKNYMSFTIFYTVVEDITQYKNIENKPIE